MKKVFVLLCLLGLIVFLLLFSGCEFGYIYPTPTPTKTPTPVSISTPVPGSTPIVMPDLTIENQIFDKDTGVAIVSFKAGTKKITVVMKAGEEKVVELSYMGLAVDIPVQLSETGTVHIGERK